MIVHENYSANDLLHRIKYLDSKVTHWLNNNLKLFNFENNKYTKNNYTSNYSIAEQIKPFCELSFLYFFLNDNTEIKHSIKNIINDSLIKYDWTSILFTNAELFNAFISLDSFSYLTNGYGIFSKEDIVNVSSIFLKNPYRMIEVQTYLAIVHEEKPKIHFNNLTILGKIKNVNEVSYMDIYSLTHEIFYIYFLDKFKKKEWFLYDLDYIYLKEYVFNLISYVIFDGHIDLLIELILCVKLLNFDLNNYDINLLVKSLDFIIENMNLEGGIIPHIEYDSNEFINLYHTTSIAKAMVDKWIE